MKNFSFGRMILPAWAAGITGARTMTNAAIHLERWKYYWDRIAYEKVTHWTPLPELPKEG